MLSLKQLARVLLRSFGLTIHRAGAEPGPGGVRPLWRQDGEFMRILDRIGAITLVDEVRCYILYQCAKHTRSLPGAAAEVGVYRGGTARLLADAVHGTGKPLHLFDTFGGMPATDPGKDLHALGDFADTSPEAVLKLLHGRDGVFLHVGVFPYTAAAVANESFCLVHVDADIYRSVLDSCAFFYPRLVPAGMMIFDDYGFPSCPGAKEAVDAFFASRKEQPIYLPSGQCLVSKLS